MFSNDATNSAIQSRRSILRDCFPSLAMTSRIKPAGNEDAHEKPREVFLQPRFSGFPNSAPSQKQFLSAESREVKVSPANPSVQFSILIKQKSSSCIIQINL